MTDNNEDGVSPIMAVLLMIAITIILGGIVAVWVYQYANLAEDDGDHYIFDIQLDGTLDQISFSIVSGEALNTSHTEILIEGSNVNISQMMISAGVVVELASPIDMEVGIYYNIKVIVRNFLLFDTDIIAAP